MIDPSVGGDPTCTETPLEPVEVTQPSPTVFSEGWAGRRGLVISVIVGALLIALLVCGFAYLWLRKCSLAPSGGCYFFGRMELPVPQFRQSDERWRQDLLGETPDTLGATGCAISSIAMVLSYYGIDTDPQRLNRFLIEHGGYTPQGWVYWEKAAEIAPDRVRHIYEDLPSYYLIDRNLIRRNPVIIRVRLPSGVTHFVVIVGKAGFDYLIRDPGGGARKGIYPLREIGSDIQALRFYEKL